MPTLCKRGKESAKKKYKVYPSAYANLYASKVCKGQAKDYNGNIYSNKEYLKRLKTANKSGGKGELDRWVREKWVNICDNNKPCGRSKNVSLRRKSYPYCRPSKRISKRTPKTVGELSKSEIDKRCKKKRSKRQGVKGKPTFTRFSQEKISLGDFSRSEKSRFSSKRTSKDMKTRYPFLSLRKANKYKQLAKERGVSKVARGEVKSTQTDMGFMEAYAKVGGRKDRLKTFPVKKSKPDGQTWWERRNAFNARHLAQMKKNNRPFFETKGKYKGTPTRQHLGLIMWAYSPYPSKL